MLKFPWRYDTAGNRLMPGNLGFWELAIIFVVALLIFGPRKLPELGRSLGKTLGEFRRATNELKRTWEEEVQAEERELRQIQKDFDQE